MARLVASKNPLDPFNAAEVNAIVTSLDELASTGLADLAALAAVNASSRNTRVLLSVINIGLYSWIANSLLPSNAVTVVRPTDLASDATAGRWVLQVTARALSDNTLGSSTLLTNALIPTGFSATPNTSDSGFPNSNFGFLITHKRVGAGSNAWDGYQMYHADQGPTWTRTWTGSAWNAWTPANQRAEIVADNAALQAITAASRNAGYTRASIGARVYVFDSTDLTVSNAVTNIRPTDIATDATAGRWALIVTNALGVGAKSQKGTAQSIPNATSTAITFTAEDYDDLNFHDNVTNTSRFTIPAGMGGRYRVEINARIGAGGAAAEHKIIIGVNGVETRAADSVNPAASVTFHSAADTIPLNAGDYVELIVQQLSGAAVNLDYGMLTITRVR